MNKYLIWIFGTLLMLVPIAALADAPQGATVNTQHANPALTPGTHVGGMTSLADAKGLNSAGKLLLVDRDGRRGERHERFEHRDRDRDWDRYRERRWGYHPNWGYREWRENQWRHGYWGRGPSWRWGGSRCFWLLDPFGNQTEFFCQ